MHSPTQGNSLQSRPLQINQFFEKLFDFGYLLLLKLFTSSDVEGNKCQKYDAYPKLDTARLNFDLKNLASANRLHSCLTDLSLAIDQAIAAHNDVSNPDRLSFVPYFQPLA